MEADDAPSGAKRYTIDGFLVVIIVVLCGTALPTFHPAQFRLREWLNPLIDGLGLWQGQWQLFAPEADKVNSAIVGVVEYDDGTTYEWRSPEWSQRSPWHKFRHFRMMEYADGVRLDDNAGAWDALAAHVYAVGSDATGDTPPKPGTVSLWRHWTVIPPPEEPLRPMSESFRPDQRIKFHEIRVSP